MFAGAASNSATHFTPSGVSDQLHVPSYKHSTPTELLLRENISEG